MSDKKNKQQPDESKKGQEKDEQKYDVVKSYWMFGDFDKFNQTQEVKVQVPGVGNQTMPTKKVLTSVAQQIYNLMSVLGQKELIISLRDNSSSLVANKRLEISVSGLGAKKEESSEEGKEQDEGNNI